MPSTSETAVRTENADGDAQLPLLLVSTESQLRDDVALTAAVVGARLLHFSSWEQVFAFEDEQQTEHPLVLLCSAEMLPVPTALLRSSRVQSGTGQQVLLLGYHAHQLWQTAATHEAVIPVPLPEAEAWLSEHLTAVALDRERGAISAFIGACGGVGTTTWSYLCAAELAARGKNVLLLDAAAGPGSGAAALAAQLRQPQQSAAEELTWSELARAEGRISSSQLRSSVADFQGVAVLTDSRRCPRPEQISAVLEAGRRVYDALLIDCGVRVDVLSGLEDQVDSAAVVLRPSARGIDAAQAASRQLLRVPLSLIVNGRAAAGSSSSDTLARTGLPLAADCAEQRWLRRRDDLGEAYELLRTRRGASWVAEALSRLGLLAGGADG